jgi:hypothetical protein
VLMPIIVTIVSILVEANFEVVFVFGIGDRHLPHHDRPRKNPTESIHQRSGGGQVSKFLQIVLQNSPERKVWGVLRGWRPI